MTNRAPSAVGRHGALPVWLAVGVVAAGLSPRHLAADDRRVPGQYATIQAAIDAARPFDRVLVASGTYRERLVFPGFPLVVESERGAAETIIDARGQGSVVTFDDRDTVLTVLKGFTLTGGRVRADKAEGGGIHCRFGSPVIAENIVADNQTLGKIYSLGGGLYTLGRPLVVLNEFRTNLVAGTERNTVLGGGGIHAMGGVFLGNRVTGNTVLGNRDVADRVRFARGGGAYLGGDVVFVNNRVDGNAAGLFCLIATGGGLHLEGTPVVAVNLIHANTARATVGRGGGLHCGGRSRPVIFGNVIAENVAQVDTLTNPGPALGGGIYVQDDARPLIGYNTVHRNRVSGNDGLGAGLAAEPGSAPTITGCVFWENACWREGRAASRSSFHGVKASAVRYCLVGDGQFAGRNHNFAADPRLVDLYHLGRRSPCIDAGEPAAAPPVAFDIDDGDRIADGLSLGQPRIDVGADEFAALARRAPETVPPGTPVHFALTVPSAAGKPYLLAASLGDDGIPLPPPDRRRVPLRFDPLFVMSLGRDAGPFLGFGGTLDEAGEATAVLDASAWPGLTVHVAGLVREGARVLLVTNPVRVTWQRRRP